MEYSVRILKIGFKSKFRGSKFKTHPQPHPNSSLTHTPPQPSPPPSPCSRCGVNNCYAGHCFGLRNYVTGVISPETRQLLLLNSSLLFFLFIFSNFHDTLIIPVTFNSSYFERSCWAQGRVVILKKERSPIRKSMVSCAK